MRSTLALLAVLMLASAACSDDGGGGGGPALGSTSTTTPAGTPPGTTDPDTSQPLDSTDIVPGGSATVIASVDLAGRRILTDPAGFALYVYSSDSPGVSTCLETCVEEWPPYIIDDQPSAGEGVPGLVATIQRPDLGSQVTYDGLPLYYYIDDDAPQETYGDFGGSFSVVILQ